MAGARGIGVRDSDAADGAADEGALRSIIDHSPDGVVVLDAANRLRFANRAARALLDLEGDALGTRLELPIVAGRPTLLDVKHDHVERCIELVATGIDWQGEPATLVSMRDVTERRRHEQRERGLAVEHARRIEAERRAGRAAFRATVGNALIKSLALGINLHELTRACCQSGFSDWCAIDLLEDGEIVRRSASADVPDVRYPERECLYASEPTVSRLAPTEARELERRLDGDWSRGVLACVPVWLHQEPVGVLAFARRERAFEQEDLEAARDIASRVAVSIEHARLYDEAQRAGHAKSQFLAVMSHELRTPLNAVIGYSDLLLLGIAGPMNDKQRDIISKVQTSSKHLISLVEEILTYTRLERGQEGLNIEELTAEGIVGETVDMVAPMARASGLEFRTTIDQPQQRFATDAQKLRQVLTNLLTNAIKYTERGWVSLHVRPDAGGGIQFEVADSGIGMTPEHIAHVYDPFWQAEPSNTRRHGGTGLGLTVAMGLTRMVGGRLYVTSELGVGTTFTLRLPAQPPA
jgi:signal transduction histidine kinase